MLTHLTPTGNNKQKAICQGYCDGLNLLFQAGLQNQDLQVMPVTLQV